MIARLLFLACLLAGVVSAQSTQPRKDIPAIAKAANGVVVSIITSDKDGKPVAQGTGFVVSKDGRIVTNYHVIKGARSAIVKLPDGAFYDVDGVVAFDKLRDLAVIKAHGQNFRVATLGNSDRVQVGEDIVAIGSPLSLESTVSSGIVSGIRTIEGEGGKFLQVTAPISPGSSGGPLFNMAGEVVGITTLYLKDGENLNFAVPVNDAKLLLATGSKVQDFPTQTSDPLANLGTPATPNTGPSTTVPTSAARAFYKQLYDAGGFSFQETMAFVCLNDDPSSQIFFTFAAMAYDAEYAKALKVLQTPPPQPLDFRAADSEIENAFHTMGSIQASAPYINFLDDDAIARMKPELRAKFQSEGLALFTAWFYQKGVMTGGADYRRMENRNSWVGEQSLDSGRVIKSTIAIEPATLRYSEIETVGASSVGSTLGSGSCERIQRKPSN